MDHSQSIEDLIQSLTTAANNFFLLPTPETLAVFKEISQQSIEHAESQFEQHRSAWDEVHPIIKAILGVLAALTMIPALVVTAVAPNGYSGVFFSRDTQLKQQIAAITTTVNETGERMEGELTRLKGLD